MILNILFGLAGGLLTASWGAFKDSPYEGFSKASFLRSLLITTIYYVGLLNLVATDSYYTHQFIALLSAIALERLTQEYWKAFFRKEQRAQIYKIPQSFHILGQVQSYTLRILMGITLTIISLWVIFYFSNITFTGNDWVIPAIILALVPTIGGAWKDAPTEGFEVKKFPRSFIIMFLSSALLHNYTNNLLVLILGSAGLERVIVEFYKTFVVLSTPGKFHVKVIHEEWINNRKVFIFSYLLSLVLIVLLWQ